MIANFGPMEDVAKVVRTNRVLKSDGYYSIVINKPQDCVYDISEIVLRHYTDGRPSAIQCAEIPEAIRENMNKFNFLPLEEYVQFLEKNLNVFLGGKIPETEWKEQRVLRPGELPDSFRFPTTNAVTPNLKHDIYKMGILLLCCLRPNIVVRCRCGEISSMCSNVLCKRCGACIGFVYVPIVDSEFLGFLQLKRCEFVCFNPARYQFSCLECHKAYESGDVRTGEVHVQKCYGCFNRLEIKVGKLEYYQKRDVKVQEGKELPNKGTCKHYRKSFRWFRFGCCNSLYPCDICHDEQSGHKSQIASRMVCGLCSREQNVKKECGCGMSVSKRHTQFWEGGRGNRDRATLSKKDSRKYS